jgi:phage terminase large subunit-like protein
MNPIEKEYLDNLDTLTRQKVQAMDKLLSYVPNSPKFTAFHKSTAKTRLMLGGRRSGKTTAGVVETCWAALGIHPYLDYPPPPLNIRICSVDFASGKQIILPQLYEWLPKHSINKWWSEDRILELTNGTTIDIKSYDQDVEKFEGVARHLVVMDEEPRKDIYESNYLRTIAAGVDGKLIITCTPLHGMTWLYYTLYDNPDAKPPAVEYWHVPTFENPHLDPDSLERIKSDPAMRDNLEASLYGKFFSHEGLVYKQFDYDKHVIAPIKSVPHEWMVILGIDPHDRNPHGVLFCGLTPQNAWIVFDEILEPCIIEDLARKIRSRLPGRWPPNLAIIDTSANIVQSIAGQSVSDELRNKYGIYTIPAHKDIRAGRLKVSSLLDPGDERKPQLYFTSNCHNLIREIRHYIWDDWAYRRKEKLDPKEKPMKKDDHLLDCLRYVVMSNVVYRPPDYGPSRKPPEHINPRTAYF